MKRFSLVLGLALVLSLVFVGSAFANFGPHGGYATDTDSCAGCHRAHSSFSSVTFAASGDPQQPAGDQAYALLVGSASTMSEFCYACHGDQAPGASTNVQSGVFDSGPSGAAGQVAGDLNGGVAVQYVTQSTYGAPLNGGGFGQSVLGANANKILDTATWEDSNGATAVYKPVTSAHSMDSATKGVLWGAGSSVANNTNQIDFTCTSCHDPHGSSNYRLLKDNVNGVAVGGYNGDVPSGAVFSNEYGYPGTPQAVGDPNGWQLHSDGALQMAAYQPNYTAGSSLIRGGSLGGPGSMSTWCAGCHQSYDSASGHAVVANGVKDIVAGTYDYGTFEGGLAGPNPGARVRHRHPVDIPLQAGWKAPGDLNNTLYVAPIIDKRIPLELTAAGASDPTFNNVGCLTCHFAHGSTASMSGWSNAHLVQNQNGTWVPERDGKMGVDPDKVDDPMAVANGPFVDQFTGAAVTGGTSALLRADNRGVCERCHNK